MGVMLRRLLILSLLSVSLGLFTHSSSAQALIPQAAPHQIFMGILYVTTPPAWLGPDGGLIPAVVVDQQTPTTVYAGIWGAGVFKSIDAGSTWHQVSNGLGNNYINALAIDPGNPTILYAGTYKGKLYKTTNAGQSWFLSSDGIQDEAIVYSIVVNPQSTNILYVATRGVSNNNAPPWSGVIYKTVDGGATWQPAISDLAGNDQQDWAYALAINPNSTNIIYAATHQHGPYRSTNSGKTWSSITNGITNFSTRAIVVDPASGIPPVLYTGVWTKSGVFKSTDGGKSWTLKSSGISGANIYQMAIDPFQTNILYAATYNMGIMRTKDGGNTWVPSGLHDDPIGTVVVNPVDSQVVYGATAGNGLFISTDRGASWTHSQSGLQASNVTGLVVKPDKPATLYAGLNGGGVAKSSDSGSTWSELNTNLGDKFIHGLLMNPGGSTLFALTNGSGIYRCELSAGNCWVKSDIHQPVPAETAQASASFTRREELLGQLYDPGSPDSVEAPNPGSAPLLTMTFAPSNPAVAYLGMQEAGLYKSLDGGMIWGPVGLSPLSVWGLAVHPSDPNQVYAATSQVGTVKASMDGGATWADLPLPGLIVYSLSFIPGGGSLLAGTDNGLYRYTAPDWTPAGLSGKTVMTIAYPPGIPGVMLVGTTNGAFVSRDNGGTWGPGPNQLNGMTVQAISFDPDNPSQVYFSTTARGILRAGIAY
jgi:photosystem II stability/assembly factor-like uncharacterized protein